MRKVLALVVVIAAVGCDPPSSATDAGSAPAGASSCPGTAVPFPPAGWLQTAVPPDPGPCGCWGTSYSLGSGWCLVVDGGATLSAAAPCAGFCVGDGGVNSPAVPCAGGCNWIGKQCNAGSSSTCCASLDCDAPDGGEAGVCCGSEGFPCIPNASVCCSGSCVNDQCTAQ